MHGYETLRQLTHERLRDRDLTARAERLALATRTGRDHALRLRRAARLERLDAHHAQLRVER